MEDELDVTVVMKRVKLKELLEDAETFPFADLDDAERIWIQRKKKLEEVDE